MANVFNIGGSGANVQSKTVKSTLSQQKLVPSAGVDGFNPVIVSPMALSALTVRSTNSRQVLTPPTGIDGYNSIVVNPVQKQVVSYANMSGATVSAKKLVFPGMGSWKTVEFAYIYSIIMPESPTLNEVYQVISQVGNTSLKFLYGGSSNLILKNAPYGYTDNWIHVYLDGSSLIAEIKQDEFSFRTTGNNSYGIFVVGESSL